MNEDKKQDIGKLIAFAVVGIMALGIIATYVSNGPAEAREEPGETLLEEVTRTEQCTILMQEERIFSYCETMAGEMLPFEKQGNAE